MQKTSPLQGVVLRELDAYLEREGLEKENIDQEILQHFLISLNNKDSTLNNKIRILNKIFQTNIPLIDVQIKRSYLSNYEIQQIEFKAKGKRKNRNLAIFFLILDTGLSLDEILTISTDDIPTQKNYLFRFQDNTYKLSEQSFMYIKKTLIGSKNRVYLFHGQKGPLTRRGLQESINKLGKDAALQRPLNYQLLRNTYVFRSLKNDSQLIPKIFQKGVSWY